MSIRHEAPRVAFVLPDLNGGGAERAALNVAANAERVRTYLIVERPGGNLAGDPLAADAITVSSDRGSISRARRVARLGRTLRKLKPDLVVSMLSPFVSAASARASGAPIVHWLQAPWSRGALGSFGNLDKRRNRYLLRTLGRNSAMIAGTAPGVVAEFRAAGVDKTKLALLPNGILLPTFVPTTPAANGPIRIVTVGRLEQPKRHDLLLEAVALLSREFPIALTIVGAGKSEGTLRDQARRLGIDEFARFTGFVGSPSAYIAEAHLFVLSTDYEGFGNVIVESLACGVPVVASDVPYGPRFVLGTEDYGILVRPNSISELAEGIRRALTRFPFSTALRAAARRRAEDFALDQVVERFEQLVDEIIGGHRRKRSLSEWP